MLVLLAFLAALLVALVVVNFGGGERRVDHPIEHLYPVDDPQFHRSMALMLGPTIVEGNRVEALINGDRIFPAMLEAIRGARRTVLFETFIYWSGAIGEAFAEALSDRARAGLKVHVLLDWVGSTRVDRELVRRMRAAGVEVRMFHPLRWYNLGRMNDRTHRKLLIVDGRIGFTGGVGIAPQWCGDAQDPQHWRDCHFRVEGPVVAQMQSVMLSNWNKTTGRVLHGRAYFPDLEPAGGMPAQMFASSPSGGSESMLQMMLLAITAAVRSIDIASAYFVPGDVALAALQAAAGRGVRVRVITPGPHTDQDTVRRASRGLWGPLLEAGVQMHEYQPTMYHCKLMIVDGLLASVGSTNFDPRSFHLNDEANLNVYDRDFARRMTEVFEADLQHSQRITLADWQRRPVREKLREHATAWLAPVL
ncbi:phospholipase D-like domain-containing protein [Ramlibacter tataouinensis]|uniref:phospholipase D-like domain-containing protein n=1 Tax=Ramlibacter tataouinensis TaxID=94132 RepID=UPI0022F3AC7E|nr:phospholipase D-like domain-containing protein [Ramlibacter tataouinensis]WBY01360.1 phospholipase D-like domain-containing protein [Ramlibacter tataouinensis]